MIYYILISLVLIILLGVILYFVIKNNAKNMAELKLQISQKEVMINQLNNNISILNESLQKAKEAKTQLAETMQAVETAKTEEEKNEVVKGATDNFFNRKR